MAPAHLSDAEAGYFREFLSNIPPQIRVTVSDIPAVARWATLQAMMINAKQDIEDNGATVQTERGQVRNKSFQTVRECSDAQRRIEDSFGMSPAARAKLGLKAGSVSVDDWSPDDGDLRWLCVGDPEYERFFGKG